MTSLTLAVLLAAAPTGWALPGLRVHVTASEDLEPDRLRALATPEVVLWVTTRSNALRASTAETVRQASAAFVQQRPPLRSQDLAPFRGHVGPWLAEAGLDVSRTRRWSPGRLAVEVVGPLDAEVQERVTALRPIAVRWRPAVWPEAAEWGRAARLPGLEVMLPDGPVSGCAGVPERHHVRLRLPLARVDAAPCGLPVRVELPPDVDPARVVELLVARPDAELALDVGGDVERAERARRLLDALRQATPATAARAPGRPDAGSR